MERSAGLERLGDQLQVSGTGSLPLNCGFAQSVIKNWPDSKATMTSAPARSRRLATNEIPSFNAFLPSLSDKGA